MGKFLVWCHDHGSGPEDGKVMEAYDARSAAERWAEWEDAHSADYWIVGGETASVTVRDMSDGTETNFRINGEQTAVYSASAA